MAWYNYWHALWPIKNNPNFFLAVGFCLCSSVAALGAEEFLLEDIEVGCGSSLGGFSRSRGGDRALNLPDEDLVKILFSIGLGVLLMGEDDLVTGGSSYLRVS